MDGYNCMQVMKLTVGDIIELKKPHPCGEQRFKVLRTGSDVRIVCLLCGRDMTLDRVKIEKAIKKVISDQLPSETDNNGKESQ